jgi:hypothetical protein
MTLHTELTPSEAANRLAIRELFDAYAHCGGPRALSPSPRAVQQARATRSRTTVFTEGDERKIMIAALRYLDTFTKDDGRLYFARPQHRRRPEPHPIHARTAQR